MTVHFIRPRAQWLDPAVPFTYAVNGAGKIYVCPPFRGWPAIRELVVHYPGADWKDLGWEDFNLDGKVSVEDTAHLIRQAHRMYLLGSRGYSLGYGFYIGVLADIWEVRGEQYANAANVGTMGKNTTGWNNYSISVHIVVNIIDGKAQPANPAQVAAANWLIDHLEARKGAPFTRIRTHGTGDFTPCAGAGVNAQVESRVIGRGKSQQQEPEPEPDIEVAPPVPAPPVPPAVPAIPTPVPPAPADPALLVSQGTPMFFFYNSDNPADTRRYICNGLAYRHVELDDAAQMYFIGVAKHSVATALPRTTLQIAKMTDVSKA